MKDLRKSAKLSVLYGFYGIILLIGPISYYYYRKKNNKLLFDERGHLIAGIIFQWLLCLYGIILYTLETIKLFSPK